MYKIRAVSLISIGLVFFHNLAEWSIVSANEVNKDATMTVIKSEPGLNLSIIPPGGRTIILERKSNHTTRQNITVYSYPSPGSTINKEDLQRTQMISILGFSAIILMAIFAWLFSKHYCCFLEKTTVTQGGGRQLSPQFNFLGARTRTVIRRISTINVQPPKREDPPPAYDELFPQSTTTAASSSPAPPYTVVDTRTKVETNITIPESLPSSSTTTVTTISLETKPEAKDPEFNGTTTTTTTVVAIV